MSDNNVIKAKISKELSKSGFVGLILPMLGLVLAFIIAILMVGDDTFVIVTSLIFAFYVILFLIHIAISYRRRNLTELSASYSEIVGSHTALIPVAKIALRMPIDKIDNVSVVNNFFFLFTGKAIIINSTSGTIKIPYVLNADEVVAYISEAIDKARKEKARPAINNEVNQSDYASSLKKLAELKDAGIITEEEFNQKKSELLGKI